jgi:hypothetical protein
MTITKICHFFNFFFGAAFSGVLITLGYAYSHHTGRFLANFS